MLDYDKIEFNTLSDKIKDKTVDMSVGDSISLSGFAVFVPFSFGAGITKEIIITKTGDNKYDVRKETDKSLIVKRIDYFNRIMSASCKHQRVVK